MENKDIIDRIFRNFERLVDNYEDLPETIEAEDNFWKYMDEKYLKNESNKDKYIFEKVFGDVGLFRERQGFLYGFNYAVKMFGKDITE